MDGFRLCLATSGPTKRRKHYVCLLFSQYCVCYFLNIVSNPNRRSPSKNQFRDYHAWNRIEKLMPQHYTNFLKLLKLYEKRPTCFQTLTFGRNLGFPKPWICPWICPWIFHGFPTPWPGSHGRALMAGLLHGSFCGGRAGLRRSGMAGWAGNLNEMTHLQLTTEWNYF